MLVTAFASLTPDTLVNWKRLRRPAQRTCPSLKMASTENLAGREVSLSDDLLLREANHRCYNDLQLVISLLAFQGRCAENPETQQALTDAMERIAVLGKARRALHNERHHSLIGALEQVCTALNAQANLRSIRVSLRADQDVLGLSSTEIITLALVANELATNAIKHGFEERKAGEITFSVQGGQDEELRLIVDDDGLPFPDSSALGGDGLGLGLAKRLMASIGGLLIPPVSGSKAFELRVSR